MHVTIADLMRTPVMTITKHQTAEHAREVMREHGVSALPVVGPDQEPLGMVTATDLLGDHPGGAPVSSFMSAHPYTVPSTEGPHVAARIMRNHHLHHVIVVDHHRVVGMVSSFDLLRLVEDHRYQSRQAPTPAHKVPNRR